MGDPDPGFEHETGEAANRDLDSHPVLIHQNECGVNDVDLPVFEKDDGGALFQRNWAKGDVGGISHLAALADRCDRQQSEPHRLPVSDAGPKRGGK